MVEAVIAAEEGGQHRHPGQALGLVDKIERAAMAQPVGEGLCLAGEHLGVDAHPLFAEGRGDEFSQPSVVRAPPSGQTWRPDDVEAHSWIRGRQDGLLVHEDLLHQFGGEDGAEFGSGDFVAGDVSVAGVERIHESVEVVREPAQVLEALPLRARRQRRCSAGVGHEVGAP